MINREGNTCFIFEPAQIYKHANLRISFPGQTPSPVGRSVSASLSLVTVVSRVRTSRDIDRELITAFEAKNYIRIVSCTSRHRVLICCCINTPDKVNSSRSATIGPWTRLCSFRGKSSMIRTASCLEEFFGACELGKPDVNSFSLLSVRAAHRSRPLLPWGVRWLLVSSSPPSPCSSSAVINGTTKLQAAERVTEMDYKHFSAGVSLFRSYSGTSGCPLHPIE